MPPDISLLTTANAAVLLSVKPQTLRKWRLNGRGPRYCRLGGPGGRVAYRPADIEEWLSKSTFSSTSSETVTRSARASGSRRDEK